MGGGGSRVSWRPSVELSRGGVLLARVVSEAARPCFAERTRPTKRRVGGKSRCSSIAPREGERRDLSRPPPRRRTDSRRVSSTLSRSWPLYLRRRRARHSRPSTPSSLQRVRKLHLARSRRSKARRSRRRAWTGEQRQEGRVKERRRRCCPRWNGERRPHRTTGRDQRSKRSSTRPRLSSLTRLCRRRWTQTREDREGASARWSWTRKSACSEGRERLVSSRPPSSLSRRRLKRLGRSSDGRRVAHLQHRGAQHWYRRRYVLAPTSSTPRDPQSQIPRYVRSTAPAVRLAPLIQVEVD